ncbi:hypothetical protein GQ457_05G030270 [Hibiscus cannabinus]
MRNVAMGSWHIASLGKARRKGGSSITFVQVQFLWLCPDFCSFGLEYRYSLVVSVPNFNTRIWVSVLLEEYRYPFEFHVRFDSDIPRVTTSGRFCDWTGSRG